MNKLFLNISILATVFIVVSCGEDKGEEGTVNPNNSNIPTSINDVDRIQIIEIDEQDAQYNDTTVYVFNDNGKIDSIIYGEYSNNPKDYDIMTYNSEGKVTDYDVYYDNITQLEDSRTFSYNISGQVEKITYKDTNPRIDSLYWENDKLITEKSYGYSGSEYELSNIDIKKYNGDNIIEELKYTVTDLGFGIDTLLYDSITYSNFLDIPNLLEEGIEGVYGFGFPLWRNLNFYQNESYTEIDINSGTEDLSTAVFSINSENDFPITVTETYDDGNVYTHKFTYTLK